MPKLECVCVRGMEKESDPSLSSHSGLGFSCKNVNMTENEVEVSALMDSFGSCHCVKSNLLAQVSELINYLHILDWPGG